MAGVSLKCGDCGALLKSVQEAQDHAELTSHSNFSESTEPVLNLVCSICGKPCRSKTVRSIFAFSCKIFSLILNFFKLDLIYPCLFGIVKESELHTKRTGHTEFMDKTSEAAKPISLEVPKVVDSEEDAVSSACSGQPEGQTANFDWFSSIVELYRVWTLPN